jgi:hypothetical protein
VLLAVTTANVAGGRFRGSADDDDDDNEPPMMDEDGEVDDKGVLSTRDRLSKEMEGSGADDDVTLRGRVGVS